jgi:hypothetical protein
MAYTTPPTFNPGDILAAADLNVLGDDIEYLKAIADGIGFTAVQLSRSGATSLANGTWTPTTWTAEIYDYGGWFSSGTDIVVPAGAIPAGFTTIALYANFGASFAANGAGYRGCRITQNGSSVLAQTQPGFASDSAIVLGSGFVVVEVGDVLTLETFQNSGGALNISSVGIQIARFAPVA